MLPALELRRFCRLSAGLLYGAALLAGCAGTHLAQPAPNKNSAGRIAQATVEWIEPAAMPVSINKGAAGYGYTPAKPVIGDQDQREARLRVQAVIAAYRQAAAPMLTDALAKEGVVPGSQTRISLRPVQVSIDANNGSVHVALEVSVRHADAASPWQITPVTQNMLDAKYWNVLRKPGIGSEADVDLSKLVVSTNDTILRELKLAGWFR